MYGLDESMDISEEKEAYATALFWLICNPKKGILGAENPTIIKMVGQKIMDWADSGEKEDKE